MRSSRSVLSCVTRECSQAARTYRPWKTRLPALRALEDTKIIDTLRGLNKRDARGRPRPETMYGRRKMTAWLRRKGFAEVSKHTVDRLMRDEGMNGLVRGGERPAPPFRARTESAPGTN